MAVGKVLTTLMVTPDILIFLGYGDDLRDSRDLTCTLRLQLLSSLRLGYVGHVHFTQILYCDLKSLYNEIGRKSFLDLII